MRRLRCSWWSQDIEAGACPQEEGMGVLLGSTSRSSNTWSWHDDRASEACSGPLPCHPRARFPRHRTGHRRRANSRGHPPARCRSGLAAHGPSEKWPRNRVVTGHPLERADFARQKCLTPPCGTGGEVRTPGQPSRWWRSSDFRHRRAPCKGPPDSYRLHEPAR